MRILVVLLLLAGCTKVNLAHDVPGKDPAPVMHQYDDSDLYDEDVDYE